MPQFIKVATTDELSEGTVEGAEVTCPWHGAKFDIRTARWPAVKKLPDEGHRPRH